MFTGAPRAIDLAASHVRVERRGARLAGDEKVAILAHFSTDPVVTRSFSALVTEFTQAEYDVVVISSATCPGELDWGQTDLGDALVLRKPNVGYDFGSWAVALAQLPDFRAAKHLVLTNDSLVGPFASLAPLLHQFEATRADVWGLTETLQFRRHLQSFFLGFSGGVLQERPLADFWANVRHFDDKNLVIHQGELGLGRLLADEGYAVDAAFVAGQVVDPADNPTIAGWRRLLERGLPFVKRELVRTPTLAADGAQIPVAVRELFGVDLRDWSA